MNILCVGDMHLKDNLSYADYISDRRVGEKKEILDFILESSQDCSHIVLLGDNFNSKNNSSETNREFVEFIEKFGDKKEIFILSGNHEKKGDGKTAIDFLAEVKKPNWHVFTKRAGMVVEGLHIDFLPFMLKSELGVETNEEAVKAIMTGKHMNGGDILFAHHAISGTSFNGIKTESLKEIVLPKEELEKRYKLVVAGHIHSPQVVGNTVITGNVMTTEVGEKERFIWKIKSGSTSGWDIEQIKIPAREIHKIENPTTEQLSSIPDNAIVKVILTNKAINVEKVREDLKRFDASLLIEDFPNERKKAHLEEGSAFDFSIEALLKLYAEERGIEYSKLLNGLQLINDQK